MSYYVCHICSERFDFQGDHAICEICDEYTCIYCRTDRDDSVCEKCDELLDTDDEEDVEYQNSS